MSGAQIDVHGLVKPALRGRIHAAALLLAIPAGVVLISRSSGAAARTAAAVYGCSLVALFAASSAYHRLGREGRSIAWLRRFDHSSIYLLIAGSYTPICVLSMSGWPRAVLLATMWTAAVLGVLLKVAWFEKTHRIGFALYLTMGWAAVLAMPLLINALPASTLLLLLAGGILYTVGAIVLATRFPNPFPRVFGYHEVWHLMVVIAAIFHYAAISDVVVNAA